MTRRRSKLVYGFVALVLALSMSAAARAALHIDITRGTMTPLPIAVPPFRGAGGNGSAQGAEIARVVSDDLQSSGLFRPLDPRSFIETVSSPNAEPQFGDWRQINAQALVVGAIDQKPDGKLEAQFRLWDVFAQQQLAGYSYASAPQNWRRIAHMIADAIYQRLTGETGYFDTHIAYVAEAGPLRRRVKRLAIMDFDGANNRFLTDGGSLVMTPSFSPVGQRLAYVSYKSGVPHVYLLDLATGRRQLLGHFRGMTFAPRFSPHGGRILLSEAQNGVTNIFSLDLRTGSRTRITNDDAIDTSPSFSPDGSQIVFNSDRGGTPQLYVMSAGGGDARRISFGSGKYGDPAWSPRGDLIAFTKIDQGSFYVGVMNPDGSGERLLTQGFQVEAPSWAPNGRVLIYFSQTPSDSQGRGFSSRLYSIDLTGYNKREVLTPGDATDPAWSPLLH
jgi:TolB protein